MVLCKLYSREPRYFEYVSVSQYTKILNVLGILKSLIFTGYIDKVLNLDFLICQISESVLETTLK